MKKFIPVIVFVVFTTCIFAQSPQKLSYQAVIRNSSNNLVTNSSIGMQISILQGSESGTSVYVERQYPNTNANGLVTLEIGNGTIISGNMNNINWGNGPYFVKTQTDLNGGANYTITGTSPILSVPYALHSISAETADYNNLTNLPTLNVSNWNTAYGWGNHAGLYRPISYVPAWGEITGKPTTVAGYGIIDAGDNWGTQQAVTDATLSGNGTTASPLKLAQQAATTGQVLKWSGTTWAPGTDLTGGGASIPGGSTGNIQFNNAGAFGGDGNLFWNNTTKKLGLGTNTPDSKLHIIHNSTITDPHIKLYESEAEYARINFQNTSGPNYWAIAALNSTTNSSERFNIYNSVSGDVVSISGTGFVGINHAPELMRRLYVDGESEGAGYFINNSGGYNTLRSINSGSSAAGYFQNNGTEYTLYATNLGTGPAAYFDGTLQIAGGNTSEINRNQTGSANLVPIGYGCVNANGTKASGGSTSNFTIIKTGTGVYELNISGETIDYYNYTVNAMLIGPGAGMIVAGSANAHVTINTYNQTGAATDRAFYFVVYKP